MTIERKAGVLLRRLALSATLFPVLAQADVADIFGIPAQAGPLSITEAFPFSAAYIAPDVILVRWDVQPGHYLYKDKVSFGLGSTDSEIAQICWPAAKVKDDPFFGKLEVFEAPVEVKVVLDQTPSRELVLSAQYQGCAADAGICYPPDQVDVSLAPPLLTPASERTAPCSAAT